MADLSRPVKASIDWNTIDLAAYNILIQLQPVEHFFGSKPDKIPPHLDPDFLTAPVPPPSPGNRTWKLSDSTRRLLYYIDYATNSYSGFSEIESDIQFCAQMILRVLKFRQRYSLLRCRYEIEPFNVGGGATSANTHICLQHFTPDMSDSRILLLVQTATQTADGTVKGFSSRPEAQVISAAIAAFQFNNAGRAEKGIEKVESMTFPAIVVTGTRPAFYKIPVTQALSDAVAEGQYPAVQTTVLKCKVAGPPGLWSGRPNEGMETPMVREEIIKYYEEFRKISQGLWELLIV
ncbi:hypothetical protein AN958_07428 [Leucoagaricus sp. SymC.cos]|nr:hypothetical protein AN958_07428 [Leucoagaricus sp. SymC.cos]